MKVVIFSLIIQISLLLSGPFAVAEVAPESHILDPSELLDEKRTERLSKRLKEAAVDNIHVYLAIYPSLPAGELAGNRAEKLQKEWLNEKYGAVLVYSQKSNIFAVIATPEYMRIKEAHDIDSVVTRAERSLQLRKQLPAIIREAAMDVEYELRIARSDFKKSKQSLLPLIFVGLAVAGVVLILIFLLGINYLRQHNLFDRTYAFPSVRKSLRLGGPVSGGHSAVFKPREKAQGE